LSIVRQDEDGAVTLILGGEIDLESAPALEHELRDAERSFPRRVVLDLAAIDFLDSTGIHLLFEAQERAETSGRQFVLRHVPGHAHRLFTLTGLISRLTVE
jgi:anti-anti-sigma factor